jgi:nucleotide-binding universal stress UspA family protein
MFATILIPLDGSKFAEAALPIGVRLARSAKARLHLVMAHQPVPLVVGMDVALPSSGFDEELRDREQSYLAETATAFGAVGEGPVHFHEADGPAGPVVCAEAGRVGADLVVMATHGRGAIGRLWLGSVADHVVRHVAIPVLLVRPAADGTPVADRPVGGILVAHDLSPHADAILDAVVTVAQLTQAHVTLVHILEPYYAVADPVVTSPIPQDPVITELRSAEAQRCLDGTADRLRARGIGVSTRVVIGGGAAGSLLEILEEERFGLIALTTMGAGGLRRFLLGSVADKLIRNAAKPVLVMRPAEVAAK